MNGHKTPLPEAKPAFSTTEFWVYVVFIFSLLVAGEASDTLQSSQVWLYGTLLTGAYLISRGLAKVGTHGNTHHHHHGNHGHGGGLSEFGERAKGAAQVLRGDADAHTTHRPEERDGLVSGEHTHQEETRPRD